MSYLDGSKTGAPKRLVATFDSEEHLPAYVRRATLSERTLVRRFDRGRALASCHQFDDPSEPPTDEDTTAVDHNPSPSMLRSASPPRLDSLRWDGALLVLPWSARS